MTRHWPTDAKRRLSTRCQSRNPNEAKSLRTPHDRTPETRCRASWCLSSRRQHKIPNKAKTSYGTPYNTMFVDRRDAYRLKADTRIWINRRASEWHDMNLTPDPRVVMCIVLMLAQDLKNENNSLRITYDTMMKTQHQASWGGQLSAFFKSINSLSYPAVLRSSPSLQYPMTAEYVISIWSIMLKSNNLICTWSWQLKFREKL